ncbi:IS4/Tn5 family transposase DNA-binding protein [Cupriavidus necator]
MEFESMDLGDKRLNKRAVLLAEQLSENPSRSIPQACGGWAQTAGAYRFFAQDRFDWRELMEPHWQCSSERMRACNVVLCIQDTTELNFNGQEIAGLGPPLSRCSIDTSVFHNTCS